MRPTYETEHDLEKERVIAPYLERAWSCNLRKLNKFGSFDYALEKIGGSGFLVVRGFVEIKRRNCAHNQYPSIMVSASKRQQALSLLETTGCPTAFVVAYDDLLKYISLIEEPCHTTVGGRFDRGDKQDAEVVIHYDINRMVCLGQSPFSKLQVA